MYVYVCICIYVYMYVCTYACVFICMYACMYICTYVCMYVYMCVYKYVCMYVYMYIHTYVCIYVHMYICMYVCIYVHMYVYMYICMYVCILQCRRVAYSTRRSLSESSKHLSKELYKSAKRVLKIHKKSPTYVHKEPYISVEFLSTKKAVKIFHTKVTLKKSPKNPQKEPYISAQRTLHIRRVSLHKKSCENLPHECPSQRALNTCQHSPVYLPMCSLHIYLCVLYSPIYLPMCSLHIHIQGSVGYLCV